MEYTETPVRHVNTLKGVIVDVTSDMVKLTDGHITLREVVHHPGGVCVAAVDDDGTVTIVSQYRYPIGRMLWELPAGKLEPGEDPAPAAARELEEETGITADRWQSLGSMYTSPGISTETLYIYLATGLHRGEPHPDPGEFLEIRSVPLAELVTMVENGEIRDAKTVIGVLRAEKILGRK